MFLVKLLFFSSLNACFIISVVGDAVNTWEEWGDDLYLAPSSITNQVSFFFDLSPFVKCVNSTTNTYAVDYRYLSFVQQCLLAF